ncbi:hypothetical protein SLE2022_194560 [Rubroshorea leprosula]
MPPAYFPLRWESTGDQWWYASPVDWATANGHYDFVRELLRIDGNHLIKLTSLRRIRRLETVWDDEEQFDDVAKCRSQVARQLFHECESKKGKNSLIRAGYGEYGVTDILYAAARGKNSQVFRLIYDFAVSPRFLTSKGEGFEEHIGDIPAVYKWEMMNRALHAAARGGNLMVLNELLSDCTDVLAYRDKHGSTILHAAAAKGQAEAVKYLLASFDIASSRDHQGNTALHAAAYRGQAAVVEALIIACPSLVSVRNNAGETFLHTAVSGFQNPAFKRVDRQTQLMKQLVCEKNFKIEDIINAKNNDGRTALHMAIIGNIHTDLVELLMSAQSINVNVRDTNGMTPLDLLRQHPHTASSDKLIRQLISAGGIFGYQDHNARRAIASHLKMQGSGSSPGTSFRISDAEIFLYTGVETISDASPGDPGIVSLGSSSPEISQIESTIENQISSVDKKPCSKNNTAQKIKSVLHWPQLKETRTKKVQKQVDGNSEQSQKKGKSSNGAPIPLRRRFAKPPLPSNNKRTLSMRSNQSSPIAKKKLASGSLDKQKGVFTETDFAGPSCSNQVHDDGKTNTASFRKSFKSQYFCFGGSGLSVKIPVSRQRQNQSVASPPIALVA